MSIVIHIRLMADPHYFHLPCRHIKILEKWRESFDLKSFLCVLYCCKIHDNVKQIRAKDSQWIIVNIAVGVERIQIISFGDFLVSF